MLNFAADLQKFHSKISHNKTRNDIRAGVIKMSRLVSLGRSKPDALFIIVSLSVI